MPLGAVYLAHGLEKQNIQFDLKIYPQYGLHVDINKLYSFLTKSRKIIALGCWSHMLPYLLSALEKIKKNSLKKLLFWEELGQQKLQK